MVTTLTELDGGFDYSGYNSIDDGFKFLSLMTSKNGFRLSCPIY